MVLQGKLKGASSATLANRPYRLDLGLDVVYVSIRDAEAAYSDYVLLPDRGIFKDHYAIIDYDQNKRAVGFTVEGLLDDYRHSSLKNRLMVDFGGLVLQHTSKRIKEIIQDYLKELMPTIDAKGRLVLSPAYA
jgi:hypothetical protein